MTVLKKTLALGAAVALIAAACGSDNGGSSADNTAAAPTSDETVVTSADDTAADSSLAPTDLEGTVTYTGYGGSGQEAVTAAWLDPFSAETGVKVVQDSPSDSLKLQQMVESGNVIWDVLQLGYTIGSNLDESELFETIDCTVVPCDELSEGGFPLKDTAVPMFTFSAVLVYNTELWDGDKPPTWADFYDTETHPGGRAIWNQGEGAMQGLLDIALLQEGVPAADLYPLDVDRAFDKLATVKSDLVFFSDFGECISLIATGEVLMGQCYNGRAIDAIEAGEAVDFTWSQQVIYAEYLRVVKGAKNVDNAMALIGYITSAENNGHLGEFIAYGPANPNSVVDPAVQSNLATANILEGADAPVYVNDDWWAENQERVSEMYLEWQAS